MWLHRWVGYTRAMWQLLTWWHPGYQAIYIRNICGFFTIYVLPMQVDICCPDFLLIFYEIHWYNLKNVERVNFSFSSCLPKYFQSWIIHASFVVAPTAHVRLALLLFLVEAMSGCWVIEQPGLSMLRFHPRVMQTLSHFKEPWLTHSGGSCWVKHLWLIYRPM